MIHCSCRHHVKVDALFNQNSNKLVRESNFYYGKLMTQKNSMSIDYTFPYILYKTTERPLRKQRFTLSSFIWSIMRLSLKRDIKRNEANVCQTKMALFQPTVGGDCTCFSTAAFSLYNFWLCCFMLSVTSHAFKKKSVLNNFCCQNQAGLRDDENFCPRRVWTLSWRCGFILIYHQTYACFLVIKCKELSDLKWPLSA